MLGALDEALAFKDVWGVLKRTYDQTAGARAIDPDEEKTFFETREILKRRFHDLEEAVGASAISRDLKLGVLEILSLESLVSLSDQKFETLRGHWLKAENGLGILLGRLERGKGRIERLQEEKIKTGVLSYLVWPSAFVALLVFLVWFLVLVFSRYF